MMAPVTILDLPDCSWYRTVSLLLAFIIADLQDILLHRFSGPSLVVHSSHYYLRSLSRTSRTFSFTDSRDILSWYQVVIITCVHYLGPPGLSPSQILGTFSRSTRYSLLLAFIISDLQDNLIPRFSGPSLVVPSRHHYLRSFSLISRTFSFSDSRGLLS